MQTRTLHQVIETEARIAAQADKTECPSMDATYHTELPSPEHYRALYFVLGRFATQSERERYAKAYYEELSRSMFASNLR